MRCDEVTMLLPALVDGEPVEVEVERHVQSCLRCQAELARYRRNDRLLDGLVEAVAVRGRVVEAVLGLERVLLVVREACVASQLRPRDEHFVKQRRKRVAMAAAANSART